MLYNFIVDVLQQDRSNCFRWSTIMGASAVSAISTVGFTLYNHARILVECIPVDAVNEFCCIAIEHSSRLKFNCPRLEYFRFRLIGHFHFKWLEALFNTDEICWNATLDLCSFVRFQKKLFRSNFPLLSSWVSALKIKLSQERFLKICGTNSSR